MTSLMLSNAVSLAQLMPSLSSENERWVVSVPNALGRAQRFVCQTEAHARRFLGVFERLFTQRARGVPQR